MVEHSALPVAEVKAELFKSLAHPARIRVLELLSHEERSAGELADALGAEPSHLSQHLRVLRKAGVVSTRREGTTIVYSLRDPRMEQILTIARAMIVANLRHDQALLTSLEGGGR
ncbi:ArsR/SmtB family transcription factor [Ruicaihuangia caeni]|uniref:Metalloregulator ArsR/SmtB family transcription factor n=1 Tax=Ruicaihuangia caeni TaxID=3042517 RepID=A0AAW6T849_9MICO|nr:metalloregulator ArsR/SmtB family transcription factor [Klugiella sp. YN-L-19]MDI2099719.1 metalloregulator ArsR/SmtB family transcription factor [Klugiella sp. YN-L-19]